MDSAGHVLCELEQRRLFDGIDGMPARLVLGQEIGQAQPPGPRVADADLGPVVPDVVDAQDDHPRLVQEALLGDARLDRASSLFRCGVFPKGRFVGDKQVTAQLVRAAQVFDAGHPAHAHSPHLARRVSGLDRVHRPLPVDPRRAGQQVLANVVGVHSLLLGLYLPENYALC